MNPLTWPRIDPAAVRLDAWRSGKWHGGCRGYTEPDHFAHWMRYWAGFATFMEDRERARN